MTTTVNARVLVVDDDPDLREIIAMVLAENDIEVKVAANGHEALSSVRHQAPDLILLDMRMPEMDGWEFSRALDREGLRRPPIIVFTAAADAAERASEVRADAWLGKPFDIGELLSTVREQLSRSSTP